MTLLTRAHSLLLVASLVTSWCAVGAAGCSSPTHETGQQRGLVDLTSDGTTVDVTARMELTTRTWGLRPAGRGFGWYDDTVECNVGAVVTMSSAGVPPRELHLDVDTEPPNRLYMDEATCERRLASLTPSSCAAEGRIAFQIDRSWHVVEAFEQRLWVVEIPSSQTTSSCEGLMLSVGTTLELVARSHEQGACDVLLAQGATLEATRCMIDYGSTGLSTSRVRGSLVEEVEAIRRGSEPTETLTRWAALVAAGASNGEGSDMEAALYAQLLDGEPDFRANLLHVDLGLGFTPSRAGRIAFIEAAIARCEADRFAPWQRDALALAAAGLGDAGVSARVKTACSVDPAGVGQIFPSHLEP